MFTVVLTLAGHGRVYATETQAQAVVDAFGGADVVKTADEWQITVEKQRGDRGAYRLHSIACAHRIPVHIA